MQSGSCPKMPVTDCAGFPITGGTACEDSICRKRNRFPSAATPIGDYLCAPTIDNGLSVFLPDAGVAVHRLDDGSKSKARMLCRIFQRRSCGVHPATSWMHPCAFLVSALPYPAEFDKTHSFQISFCFFVVNHENTPSSPMRFPEKSLKKPKKAFDIHGACCYN